MPPHSAASPVPRGLAGVGLTASQVNSAIERGASFLWRYVKENDLEGDLSRFGQSGEHVLVALALVHSEANKRFADFNKTLRRFLSRVDPSSLGTYAAGILCMLINALGDPSYLPLLRKTGRYLVESQGPEGSWNYSLNRLEGPASDPDQGKVLIVSGGRPLDGSVDPRSILKRLSPPKNGKDGDNSVSQYAVLGLRAFSSSGLLVDPSVWKGIVSAYSSRQNEDGGWGYVTGNSYGSMTCAGVASLAIALNRLGNKSPQADPRIQRGLKWLADHWSVAENPEKDEWYFYYLYSVERVGRILGTEFIGDYEWYPLGARKLIDIQRQDGAWVGSGDEEDVRLATSFALLFLTRATERLKGELKRGGTGTLKTGIETVSHLRLYLILDASGSMLAELSGRTKFQAACDTITAIVKELPEGSEVALRVYGHRKTPLEPEANEDTELLIPLEPLNAKEFFTKLNALRPRGRTPLALSLTQAASDLQGASEDNPVIVVLLTDGGEDTFPRRDPVKAAEAFSKLKGVRLEIIGFDIGRQDWEEQLISMASRAGGHYRPAADATALAAELKRAVLGFPEGFLILSPDGKEVTRGKFGETRILPEGRYQILALGPGGFERWKDNFWINTGEVTSVVFRTEVVRKGTGLIKAPIVPPKPEVKKPSKRRTHPNFCPFCGEKLLPPYRFCPHCGKRVGQ